MRVKKFPCPTKWLKLLDIWRGCITSKQEAPCRKDEFIFMFSLWFWIIDGGREWSKTTFNIPSMSHWCWCVNEEILSTYILQLTAHTPTVTLYMNDKMRCKAWLCNNRPETDKVKRHYFGFPSAENDKNRLERWIANIGTKLTTAETKNRNSKICSDHFHPDCYEVDMMAKVMNYEPTRKKLKPGSIPTFFAHKKFNVINMDGTVVLNTRNFVDLPAIIISKVRC